MYSLRVVSLNNGTHKKESLVIEFQDQKMSIVGEFLMTDAPMLDFNVLNLIKQVLNGQKHQENMTGNRCSLTIKSNTTLIEDTFAEIDGVTTYETYEIRTSLLHDLVLMWRNELQKLV